MAAQEKENSSRMWWMEVKHLDGGKRSIGNICPCQDATTNVVALLEVQTGCNLVGRSRHCCLEPLAVCSRAREIIGEDADIVGIAGGSPSSASKFKEIRRIKAYLSSRTRGCSRGGRWRWNRN